MFHGKCEEDIGISTTDRMIKLVTKRLEVPIAIRNDTYVNTLKRKQMDTSLPEETKAKTRKLVHWNKNGTTKLFRPQHDPTKIKRTQAEVFRIGVDKVTSSQTVRNYHQTKRERLHKLKNRALTQDFLRQKLLLRGVLMEAQKTHALAASTASEEEEQKAKELQAAGLRPVVLEKRPYRPQVQSRYIEPDFIPDTTSNLDVLFRESGNVLYAQKPELPPRDDIIVFLTKKRASRPI